MELMSSLLLCALVLVPQALGRTSTEVESGNNSSNSAIVKRISMGNSINNTRINNSKIGKVSALQSVFRDRQCKTCLACMERVVKAHKAHSRYGAVENFHNQNDNQIKKRDKRKTIKDTQDKVDKLSRKLKSKNNNTINITKYRDNKRVYALKIMETNALLYQNKSKSSCQVYSIRKSFPCESSEADVFLKETKRKINKKSKKGKSTGEKSVSNTNTTVIAPLFRKRQIEESQVLEQIMPSIEEMY